MGSSPISSKKMVPLWASSKIPCFPSDRAPVNAPFTYPNNSLSNILGDSAAQLIATNGARERELQLWMLCANSSFPVPVSPTISTVPSALAILFAHSIVCRIALLEPRISVKSALATRPFWESFERIFCSNFWISSTNLAVMIAPEYSEWTMMGAISAMIFLVR